MGVSREVVFQEEGSARFLLLLTLWEERDHFYLFISMFLPSEDLKYSNDSTTAMDKTEEETEASKCRADICLCKHLPVISRLWPSG